MHKQIPALWFRYYSTFQDFYRRQVFLKAVSVLENRNLNHTWKLKLSVLESMHFISALCEKRYRTVHFQLFLRKLKRINLCTGNRWSIGYGKIREWQLTSYNRQQNYSSTCNNTWDSSGLIVNFYHLMLIINSIKTKDRGLTNIYFIKLH